jgi:hypothetical protein
MTIIDEQGRVFGLVNAIDAAVGLFVLLLVPIAYGAYMLFRPAPVRILGVEPAVVDEGTSQRIKFRGENFRAFLTAQFGTEQVHGFFVETPSSAEAVMPALPPGTYDVTLYSEVQQVAKLPHAITVKATATSVAVHVELVGAFTGLSEDDARRLAVGQHIPDSASPVAEIIAVAAPGPDLRRLRAGDIVVSSLVAGTVQVPAVLRANCTVVERQPKCQVGDVQVTAGVIVQLPGGMNFFVDEVRGANAPAALDVDVRFIGPPEVIGLMRVGDTDTNAFDRRGALSSLGERRTVSAETTQRGAIEDVKIPQHMATVTATVRVNADVTRDGFVYRTQALRVGGTLIFDTDRYAAKGAVVRIAPHAARDAKP